MFKQYRCCGVMMAALTVIGCAAVADARLKPGDSAPPLNVAGWVKGPPVTKFQPGKIYIVDFWATWAGPAKARIPELTELAKKYPGKVTVAGVSVWERPRGDVAGYLPKIKEFVNVMGDKIGYSIAYDGAAGVMSQTWLAAAEQNGIPVSFVVDKKGRVAWIGRPISELMEVLPRVIDGTYDPVKAGIEQGNIQKEIRQLEADLKVIQQLQRAGKNAEAVAKLDSAIGTYPRFRPQLLSMKFDIVVVTDQDAATKLAREHWENEFKNNPVRLNLMAWRFVDPDGDFKNPDYELAISMAARAVELTNDKDAAAAILDTLALAHFKAGHRDKAIEFQTKAVEIVNRPDSRIDPQTKKDLEERLAMFKKSR